MYRDRKTEAQRDAIFRRDERIARARESISASGFADATRVYSVRYVHKVSPRETDTGPNVKLTPRDLASAASIAKALRRAKVMYRGEKVGDYRVDAGRLIVFPRGVPGGWHSIILTPED